MINLNDQEMHQYLHDVYINAYNAVLATAHGSQRIAENITAHVHELQRAALNAATESVKNYKETFEGFTNKPSNKK